MKAGVSTTEFWVGFIPSIVSVLVVSGIIPVESQGDFGELLKQAVLGIIAIVSIVSYIISRTELKKTAIEKGEIVG